MHQSGQTVDPYGDIIMCEKLPFDTWRTRHDQVKLVLEELVTEAGAIAQPEVYGLFSHLIPSVATEARGMLAWTRDRQGLVPNFMFTFPASYGAEACQIAELKLISAGATYYRGKQKSVDQRAHQLPKLYTDKAKAIDQKFHGASKQHVGPVEQKLNSFGNLQCLVLGQFGEASQHVHHLLNKLSTIKAKAHSRAIGRPVSEHERAGILHYFRRRLSIAAVRAQAQCLLARTGHLGDGARQAAQRRKQVRQSAERNRVDMAAHYTAHVRGRGLHQFGGLHLH